MTNLRNAAVAAAIAVVFAVAAEAKMSVQFIGTGTQTRLADALAIAGVDLANDTTLTQADIDSFSTIGANSFAGCFVAAMVDTATGVALGNGIDCIRVVGATDNGGFELDAMSFFVFTNTGTIVARGRVTLQPTLMGAGDANGTITHITGAVDSTGLIGGTGAFANAAGSVRLNGSVSIANFPSEMVFDCLWVLGVGQNQLNLTSPGEVAAKLDKIQSVVNAIARTKGIIVK